MADTNNNKKSNVSLGKPLAKGCVYIAPSGTALPTDATGALDAAFNCVGYVSEDGITNASDTDNTEVKDMGGVTVLKEISSYGETYQFAMLELNENSAKLRYGSENVTVSGDSLQIDHAMPKSESFVVVIEILLTGNKVKRIIIADATVSEFGDITYSSGDAIMYDVTLAANPSEQLDGASSREYVAALTTTAAQSDGKSTKATA